MLQRFPIALAQVKAGNTLIHLKVYQMKFISLSLYIYIYIEHTHKKKYYSDVNNSIVI